MSNNNFLKVLVAAQRAKQLHKGARPLVQNSNTRATRIALDEVERGLISFEFLPQDPNLKGGRDNRGDGRQDGNGTAGGGKNDLLYDLATGSKLSSLT